MTEKWVRDTGLMCTLLCLILGAYGNVFFLWLCAVCLLVLMFYPSAFKPIAFLWQKVADVLGMIMNKVLFGAIFFVVVTPIGYLRRRLIEDQRYEFGECFDTRSRGNKNSTAFVTRDQIIGAMDMERPY